MKELLRAKNFPEGFIVHTDFQTQGQGQRDNSWESAKGKNLLFSLLLRPRHILVENQFVISQLASLGIKNALDELVPDEAKNFFIKWPNDIYWKNKKLGGILIENTLQGRIINASVIGIGLNINQKNFYSDVPNPVSLKQITGENFSVKSVLQTVVTHIYHYYTEKNAEEIREDYRNKLYRKTGYHLYRANGEIFSARISGIGNNGRLMLEDRNGEVRGFYFKEVEAIV